MSINEQSRIWQGVHRSFSEIPYDRDVFEEAIWAEKLRSRAQALLHDADAPISVSAASLTSDYALPVVAALAARRAAALRILDFGGGLGASYIPLKSMLPGGQPLEFVVVENATVCRMGHELFADDPMIRFCTDIPVSTRFDIAHAGSSLHYVEDWQGAIGQLAETGADYLLFADLPAGDIETFVTTQLFHGRQIPVHFWNVGEFKAVVEARGYEAVLTAAYAGRYLERDATLPTAHFDSRHRLDRFCQLVFRRTGDHRTDDGTRHV